LLTTSDATGTSQWGKTGGTAITLNATTVDLKDAGTLADNVTVEGNGGAATSVTFENTMDGAHALTVNATMASFGGAVGHTTPLTSLTADASNAGGQAQFSMTAPGGTNPAGVNAGSVTINDQAVFNVTDGANASPSVQTTAGQSYLGAATLGTATVLKDTGSANISFISTLDGAQMLEVDTAGATTFKDQVGGETALQSLTVDDLAADAGGTILLGNASGHQFMLVQTEGGGQQYGNNSVATQVNPVSLGANTTLNDSGSGSITVDWTLDADLATNVRTLKVESGGATTFKNQLGGLQALQSLAVDDLAADAGGTILLGQAATVAGNASGHQFMLVQTEGGGQQYGNNSVATQVNPVSLGANTTLNDSGSGSITVDWTLDADLATNVRTLKVESGGATTFKNQLGGKQALQSLSVDDLAGDAGGTIVLGNTATSANMVVQTEGGGQSYGNNGMATQSNPLALGAGTVLNDNSSGSITVDGTVDGGYALTAETAGATIFKDQLGGTTRLQSLTVEDLSADAGGTITLGNAATNANMVVQTEGGGQSYGNNGVPTQSNPLALGAGTVLNDNNSGSITVDGTVDGGYALTVNTAGKMQFGNGGNDWVGSTHALASLTTDDSNAPAAETGGTTVFDIAESATTLNAGVTAPSVTTSGSQTYSNAVQLQLDTVLTSTESGNITFGLLADPVASTVDTASNATAARALTVNTQGNVTFYGNVGSNTPLQSLTVGTLTSNGTQDSSTPGNIYLFSNVTMTGNDASDNVYFDGNSNIVKVAGIGDIVCYASGNINFYTPASGTNVIKANTVTVESTAGEIETVLGNVPEQGIDAGIVLESTKVTTADPSIGDVSTAPPVLLVQNQGVNSPVTPANPVQTVTGTIGRSSQESGKNFCLEIVWYDGAVWVLGPSGPPPGTSGDQNSYLPLGVDFQSGNTYHIISNPSSPDTPELASTTPSGDNLVHFVVQRTYVTADLQKHFGALATDTAFTLPTIVLAGNDGYYDNFQGDFISGSNTEPTPTSVVPGNILLYDSGHPYSANPLLSQPTLNFAHGSSMAILASSFGGQQPQKSSGVAPAAVAETTAVVAEINSVTALTTKFEESQAPVETAPEDARGFYLVRVESDGSEGEHVPLPDDALSNLGGLFQKFRKQGLPNGTYRVYMTEAGFQPRKLIEFYKSGNSFGDPVREPGRGSNPISGADQSAPIPSKQDTPKVGATKQRNDHPETGRHAATVVPAAPVARPTASGGAGREAEQGPMASLDPHGDAGNRIGDKKSQWSGRLLQPLAGAAAIAIGGLPSYLRKDRWDRMADKAMEDSEAGSFGLVARLQRRLRREK